MTAYALYMPSVQCTAVSSKLVTVSSTPIDFQHLKEVLQVTGHTKRCTHSNKVQNPVSVSVIH